MGTIHRSDRIAVTLYSLGTLFVSGMNICVKIPCIKEIVYLPIIIIIMPHKWKQVRS
jgi:hypothetical protein